MFGADHDGRIRPAAGATAPAGTLIDASVLVFGAWVVGAPRSAAFCDPVHVGRT